MFGLAVFAVVGTPVGVAILSVVGILAGGLLTQLFGRRKQAAEVTDLITQAAGRLIGDLGRRIDQLTFKIEALTAEVIRLGGDPRVGDQGHHTVITTTTSVSPTHVDPHIILPNA